MRKQAKSVAGRAGCTRWSGPRQCGQAGTSSPSGESSTWDAFLQCSIARGECAQAFERLWQGYQAAIVHYCTRYFLDPALAEDVAQEIFLAAFEGMMRFRGDSSVRTWLYAIAAKKCLEVTRERTRRTAVLQQRQEQIRTLMHCDPPPEPENLVWQAYQRQAVWQALHRLRRRDRDLLLLRYAEKLTYEEIARLQGVSSRTVERHLPHAVAQFHKIYRKLQFVLCVHLTGIHHELVRAAKGSLPPTRSAKSAADSGPLQ